MKYLSQNLRIFIIFTFAAFILTACQKDKDLQLLQNDNSYLKTASNDQCGEATVVNFYAAGSILIGDVTVYNSGTALHIDINTTGGWVMSNVNVYAGALANVPIDLSNYPIVSQFPYSTQNSPMVSAQSFVIPLDDLGACFMIAVNADVALLDQNNEIIESEIAWAGDSHFPSSEFWATYFDYCLQVCENCEYVVQNFNLYGGQTILVGNLAVTNDATNLYVNYTTTGNWFLSQTHLYVGTLAGLPTAGNNAPIPGHFPYSGNHSAGTQTVTYTIPLASLPPCFIIVAHAAVVRVVNGQPTRTETAFSFGTPFPNTRRWGWYSDYCTQVCQ